MEPNINTNSASDNIPKQSKWVKGSVILAIVIVMNLFFNYAISLVYQEPTYNDYYKDEQVINQIKTKEDCLAIGGQWDASYYTSYQGDKTNASVPDGYCNKTFTIQKNFEAAKSTYDRNVFITLVILGVMVLVIGAFVKVGVLSLSFSWGGVLSLIIASMRYWSSADKIVRVVILALALAALIWLAVKKFGNK